jgi:F420-0:gamma-glutamyl ligase
MAKRRVVVLLTDGESAPFNPGAVAASLRPAGLVVVRFWRAGEAIAGEPAYRPDPTGEATLAALAAAAGGRVFGEGDIGAAGAAIRAKLGSGPTARVTTRRREETALAPFVVLAALVPLGLFVRRRRVT